MNKLTLLTQMPEIESIVVSDQTGLLTESHNEPDAESIAAVMGVVCDAVKKPGESLGFGAPSRMVIVSSQKSWLLYFANNLVLTIKVDSNKPVAAIEKKIKLTLGI